MTLTASSLTASIILALLRQTLPLALMLALGLGILPAFAHPSSGIVVDESGATIFADERRNIVFRIDSAGKTTRWVTGKHCHELFLDPNGSLYGEHLEYLSQTAGWRSSVWKRDVDGRLSDVYGPAAGFPPGLLLDPQGNRYQSNANENPDSRAPVITQRSPEGRIAVLAGGQRGTRDGRGDQAQLGNVVAMSWGPDQTLYFIEDDAVRCMTLDGNVVTLARGFRGPKDPELPAQRMWGLAVDRSGSALVADYGNRRVIKVTRDGKISTTLSAEKPWSPTGVALAGDTVYVLEHGFEPPSTPLGPRVRKLFPGRNPIVLVTVTNQLFQD